MQHEDTASVADCGADDTAYHTVRPLGVRPGVPGVEGHRHQLQVLICQYLADRRRQEPARRTKKTASVILKANGLADGMIALLDLPPQGVRLEQIAQAVRISMVDENMAIGMDLGRETGAVIDGTPADTEGRLYSAASQRLKQAGCGLRCCIRAIIER